MPRIKYWNEATQTWERVDSGKTLHPDSTGVTGVTKEQVEALDNMFKVCTYKEDPATQYEAFKKAFNIGSITPPDPEPEIPAEKTYTVINNLTNAKNGNTTTIIKEKTAYTAKITADAGFTLTGASVEITMGGINVTSTVYKDGDINIASVTGNIVITVSAIKMKVPEPPKNNYLDDPANILFENTENDKIKIVLVDLEKFNNKIYYVGYTDWRYGNSLDVTYYIKEDYEYKRLPAGTITPIYYNHYDKGFFVVEIDKALTLSAINEHIKNSSTPNGTLSEITFGLINSRVKHCKLLKEYKE